VSSMPAASTSREPLEFSLVRGGPLYRLRRSLGLVPDNHLGLAVRTAIVVAITWVPIIVGAVVEGRAFEGQGSDPLLRHFGIHGRLLLSVPLLIFAEATMERMVPILVKHFTASGLVTEDITPQFAAILRSAERLRDSLWGEVFVLVSVAGTLFSGSAQVLGEEMAWVADQSGRAAVGFAGWWFLFVGRAVFTGLIAIWLWRFFVGWVLVWRITALDLRLVPSHPDGAGGLGFMQNLSRAAAPIVLATSVVLAGRWAHDVLYHGTHLDSLVPQLVAYVAIVLVVFLMPLLLLGRNLWAFKHRSLLQYATLIGQQGRLVDEKWIRGHNVGEPAILAAPEIGPVADAITLYDAVSRIRVVPVGLQAVLPLLVAALLPMLPVAAIEIPVKDLVLKLAGALI
jgi:hypothetical protein